MHFMENGLSPIKEKKNLVFQFNKISGSKYHFSRYIIYYIILDDLLCNLRFSS